MDTIPQREIAISSHNGLIYASHYATIPIPVELIMPYHNNIPSEFVDMVPKGSEDKNRVVCIDCWEIMTDKRKEFYTMTLGISDRQIAIELDKLMGVIQKVEGSLKDNSGRAYIIFPWLSVFVAPDRESIPKKMEELLVDKGLSDSVGTWLKEIADKPQNVYYILSDTFGVDHSRNNRTYGAGYNRNDNRAIIPASQPNTKTTSAYNISSIVFSVEPNNIKVKTVDTTVPKEA